MESPRAATPVLTPRGPPSEDAPKRNVAQRLPPTAPAVVCIYKAQLSGLRFCLRPRANKQVTDRAGDVWSNFESTDAALYQVQIDHAARPSVAPGSSFFPVACVRDMLHRRCWYWRMFFGFPQVFGIRESFQDFLKDAGSKSEDVPQKLEDLAASGIRLVITDKNDPDGVGFVQWRVAFYVAGGDASLGNFMCLLD